MNEPKQAEPEDLLSFFSPRMREILRRLAHYERRSEIQQMIWLIEARAYGKLSYSEERNTNPLISLENVPAPLVERVTLERKPGATLGKDYKPPPLP